MTRTLPLLLIAVCALAVLAGCGSDRGERAYYRSRYVPERVDESYTGIQRAQWRGDPEVFELPSRPPALDGEHYARVNCDKPGPQFKPQPIVAYAGEVRGNTRLDIAIIGGQDTRPVPVGALEALPGYAVGGSMHDGAPRGVYDTTMPLQESGGWDRRPRAIAGEGTAVRADVPVGVQRAMAKDDYCLTDELPPIKR